MKELSELTIKLNKKIEELRKDFPRLDICVEFRAKGEHLNVAASNWETLQEAILRHYLR